MTTAVAPQPTDVRSRRLDIAVLRIVAMVEVIAIHVSPPTLALVPRGGPTWWTAEVLNLATRSCVPAFVMVSGALLLRPGLTETAGDFYRRRLTRVLIPLLVWYSVYAVFDKVVLHARRDSFEVLSLVLTGRTYTALYFFWIILGLYVVTPPLRVLLERARPRQLLTISVAVVLTTCAWRSTATFVARHSDVDTTSTPTAFTYWIPYVGFFLLGAALTRVSVPRRAALPAALAVLVSNAAVVWSGSGSAPKALDLLLTPNYQGWAVAVATVSLFVLVTALARPSTRAPSRPAVALEALGAATLGVFALHLLVLYALRHLGPFSVDRGADRLGELAWLLSATTVLSFLLSLALARIPLVRRLV